MRNGLASLSCLILAVILFGLAATGALGAEAKPPAKPDAKAAVADPAPAAQAAAPAPAADAGGDWQKIETKLVPFADAYQTLSPGLFDRELQHVISFPKDGSPVDIELPRAGADKDGKKFRPLMARLAQGVVWIDLNGDGKPQAEETHRVNPDGMTDAFTAELHYEDGSAGQYIFRLKALVEGEKYILLRCGAREAKYQGKSILLIDDNGNGKYDDVDKDTIVVAGGPPAFLNKYVNIDDKFYEILAHQSGEVLEIRPVEKMEYGWVDAFENYKASQHSESTRIDMIIVSGPTGSFSMDEQHKNVKVPVGAYDIAFGLIERGKERVYIKKGDKTSFTVAANKVGAPQWGGVVTAKFDFSADAAVLTVGKPSFTGSGSEVYIPENFKVVQVQANLNIVVTDSRTKLEMRTPVGNRKFKVTPEGDLLPIEFKPMRLGNDEYEAVIEYNSGIMGAVQSKERLHFSYSKKAAGPSKK